MLKGTLLDLVPYTDEFDKHAVEWMNGPMGEWWGMDHVMTQAAHQRWRERERSEAERQQEVVFGLRAKDGNPIGTFALIHIKAHHRMAEVGAGIGDPAYWGGGFGSDAMLLIVEYAFNWLDFNRLWLLTSGRNQRAQRQVEKCGYTFEGRRRDYEYVDGRYSDMVFYGMMHDEWSGYDVMVERLGLREKAQQRGYSLE